MADPSQLSHPRPTPSIEPDRVTSDGPVGDGLHAVAELIGAGATDGDVADALCRAGRLAASADWALLVLDDGQPIGSAGAVPVADPSAPEPALGAILAAGDRATGSAPVRQQTPAGPLVGVPVEVPVTSPRPILVVGRVGSTAPFADDDVRALTTCVVTASLLLVAAGRPLSGRDDGQRGPATDDPLVDLSEAELWDLLESAPDAMLLTGPDGRLSMVNRQAETMFGHPRDQLIGQPVELLIPERFRRAHVANRRSYREAPSNRPMGIGLDLMGRRADGSEFPVEVSLSPARRPESTGQVIVAVRDITTRSQIEARLRETQLRFRAAFDDGPVPMALVDITPPADRIIVEANQAMADLVGYDRSDLLGMSFAELTHPDDQSRDEEAARNHLCGDNSRYSPIKRYLCADGSIVWVQLHASPLVRRDGGTLCIAHALDITDQVEATAIAERHEALDHAVSEIRLAMLRGASREQGLGLITRSAASCLGARTAIILMPTDDGEALVEQAANDGAGDGRARPALRCQNGVISNVFRSGQAGIHDPSDLAGSGLVAAAVGCAATDSVVVAPMHDGHETVGVLLIVRDASVGPLDATDLTHIERFASEAVIAIELADVAEAHQRLELLEDRERIGRDMHDKVIGRLFATGMSLQAMATMLDDEGQERALAAVTEIDAAIHEIRAAIYGIRSQVDWGKGVRGEILATAAGQRHALGFEPEITLDGEFGGLERGVVDDLLATLREALSNAAKYATARHVEVTVRVTASADGDLVELTVADDGIGFDPDAGDGPGHASQQTSSSLDHHGLANMAARAEERGGRVDIVSAPQRGTTIHWRVPLGGASGS